MEKSTHASDVLPYLHLRIAIQDLVENLYSNRLSQGIEFAIQELHTQLANFGLPTAAALCSALEREAPSLRELAQSDVQAAFAHDPAAQSLLEIELGYPGYWALQVHRIAHVVWAVDRLCARLLSEYAHSKTAIDIHPGAHIGPSFFIDHGSGVVIGESTEIASHVTLYQGVTLGALFVERSLASQKRHPSIESHVVIYSNASILGGETVIGHHSVIGGNVSITQSVPPYSKAVNRPQISLRQHTQTYSQEFHI